MRYSPRLRVLAPADRFHHRAAVSQMRPLALVENRIGQRGLQQAPALDDARREPAVDPGDAPALARMPRHEAGCGKLGQRHPDGGAAEAEAMRQLGLVDEGSGASSQAMQACRRRRAAKTSELSEAAGAGRPKPEESSIRGCWLIW